MSPPFASSIGVHTVIPVPDKGIALMLAGHTHAGQLIPFNFLVKRIYPRMRGLHESNGSRLYVSPGTGTWGPILRIGSRCEITLLEFV